MHVLEDEQECLFREADTMRHSPVALDAGETRTTPSPSAACASCAALYKARLARHRQHHRQHHQRQMHRFSTSPPRWWIWNNSSTLRSMASMSWTRRSRQSLRLQGLPTRRARTRGHGSRSRAVCARDHSRLVSSSSRVHRCAPAPTTNAVSAACMTKNNLDEKHFKSTIHLPTEEKQATRSHG